MKYRFSHSVEKGLMHRRSYRHTTTSCLQNQVNGLIKGVRIDVCTALHGRMSYCEGVIVRRGDNQIRLNDETLHKFYCC